MPRAYSMYCGAGRRWSGGSCDSQLINGPHCCALITDQIIDYLARRIFVRNVCIIGYAIYIDWNIRLALFVTNCRNKHTLLRPRTTAIKRRIAGWAKRIRKTIFRRSSPCPKPPASFRINCYSQKHFAQTSAAKRSMSEHLFQFRAHRTYQCSKSPPRNANK